MNANTAKRFVGEVVELIDEALADKEPRAERMAVGHSDYVSKHAHAATDLVFREEMS